MFGGNMIIAIDVCVCVRACVCSRVSCVVVLLSFPFRTFISSLWMELLQCSHSESQTDLTPPIYFPLTGTCPGGWEEHNGRCYQVQATPNAATTWFLAKQQCEDQGAELLILNR